MKLEGIATISIKDAKTGKVKYEVTEKNMITNAVDNVLNGALQYLMSTWNNGYGGTYNWSQIFNFPNGFLKDLFGGVLVFSEAIEQDADHIIPTEAEIKSFIGCACQDASLGGDIFRGALNEGETIMGEDFCTFVWDFTTAQSNGEVKAICLTSNLGGAVGFHQNIAPSSNGEHNTIRSPRLLNNMFVKGQHSNYTWALSKLKSTQTNKRGRIFHNNRLGEVRASTVTHRDMTEAMKDFFTLLNTNDRGKIDTSINDETISITGSYLNTWIPVLGDCEYAYAYDASVGNYLPYVQDFVIHRVDLNGVETDYTLNLEPLIENVRDFFGVTTGLPTIDMISFIKNEQIYFTTQWLNNDTGANRVRVYRMNLSDSSGAYEIGETVVTSQFISLMNVGTTHFNAMDVSPWEFCSLDDSSYISFKYNNVTNKKFYLIDDNDLTIDPSYPTISWGDSFVREGFSNLKKMDYCKAPWLGCDVSGALAKSTGSQTYLGNIVLFTPYLASINNISRVVEKTAADTMKIVYTIRKAN